MADLGTDFSLLDDLTPELSTISGVECVAQSLARRIQTPRGGLWYDPDYGIDVREFLLSPTPMPAQVAAAVEAECSKDERVESVSASVTFKDGEFEVRIDFTTSDGPFELVLNVSQLTVAVISFEAAA